MSLTRTAEPADGATAPTTASRPWAAGSHAFRVLGDAELVAAAEDVFSDLPPAAAGDAVHDYRVVTSTAGYTVTDRRPDREPESLPACLDTLQWLVNQGVIAGLTDTETGIHAACVQRGDDVVLLAGPSGAGKSTAAAGLVRAGWDYLTDETAIIDGSTLQVRPYPKPITIDHGAWPLFPEAADLPRSEQACLVPVGNLGGSVGRGGRVTAVVTLTFAAGSATQLAPMTAAEVVLSLATSTFEFSSAGARHLAVLADLARTAPGHRLVSGDLARSVDAINAMPELRS